MMNKSEHWRHRTFLLYGPCCSAFWRESPYLYRDCGANVSFLNFSKRHSQFNFKPETFVSHPSSNKNKCVVDLHVCVRKWLINDRIDRNLVHVCSNNGWTEVPMYVKMLNKCQTCMWWTGPWRIHLSELIHVSATEWRCCYKWGFSWTVLIYRCVRVAFYQV